MNSDLMVYVTNKTLHFEGVHGTNQNSGLEDIKATASLGAICTIAVSLHESWNPFKQSIKSSDY